MQSTPAWSLSSCCFYNLYVFTVWLISFVSSAWRHVRQGVDGRRVANKTQCSGEKLSQSGWRVKKKISSYPPPPAKSGGRGRQKSVVFFVYLRLFFHVFFLSFFSFSLFFLLMLSSSFVHFFCRQLSKDPKQIFYPEILRKLDEITSHEFHSRFLLLFCNWHSVFIPSLSYKCWPWIRSYIIISNHYCTSNM